MAKRRAKVLKEVTGTRRRNFNVDAQLDRLLGAFARYHGVKESTVVNTALEQLLRGFSVSSAAQEAPRAPGCEPEVAQARQDQAA